MKGFQFNLEKVLEVRQIEEDQVQELLVKAQKVAREIEENIEYLERKQNDLYQYLRERTDLQLDEALLYRNFIKRNRDSIENRKEDLKAQRDIVKERKIEYLEKRKNREVLEKLKDKRYKVFQKSVLQKEQKEIDELAQRVQN
ncbi:MAG: hypothetical protein GX175_01325 [Halanaerobiaceae bacterium]|jgi:flagellar FliJ protein|nr:hypothetical protein [Halanaerobiaceae bacterium]